MDLLEIRDKIDSVDKELVKLFEERMDLCKDVANYKIENQKQVLDRQSRNLPAVNTSRAPVNCSARLWQ